MAKSNRRHSPRQNEHASVQVLLTLGSSQDRKDKYEAIPATMCNTCDQGLYVEMDRALQPGSTVEIKMKSPDDRSKHAYYLNNGRVMWCKKVKEEPLCFGIGVKVLRQVVRAGVLTSSFL